MSSISSSTSASGLAQFFQNLQANGASSPTQVASTDPTTAATSTDPTQTGQVSGHHHHHHGGGSEMMSKLQSAVTSALQGAQANGSSDPNSVIENAIASIFKQSADPSAAGSTTAQAAGGQAIVSNTDSDGDNDGSAAAGATATSSVQQAFFQALQQYGVDPQQFHSDFLAAVQQAQNGQVNPATAFQSFPPGTAVDTIA
jgi:hypothetical protein